MQGKEKLNTWSAKDYVKNVLMLLLKVPVWAVQVMLFWLPVKKNRIIIYSLKQHGYSCNLKYLTEYLNLHFPNQLEILWVVRSREDEAMLQQRGIPVVLLHSWEHFRYRMQAEIVITNDEFYPVFLKRPGQIYVNTWHGGINYKKIGYAGLEFTNPVQRLIYRMNNPCPDVFVSGSRSFTETTSEAFGFPKEVFLECGLPRNDGFFTEETKQRAVKIKKDLGIPEDHKILLYAPTFRGRNRTPLGMGDYEKVRRCLEKKFGGRWTVLVRHHYFVKETCEQNKDFIDVSQYEDMQELLMCCDCLISDYSSCMWDFILTERPCFVFAPDRKEYGQKDRSFFIPTDNWPYPISENLDELCECIDHFDPGRYAAEIRKHRMDLGSFDTGHACKALIQRITNL